MAGGLQLWGVGLAQSWAEGVGALFTGAAFIVAARVFSRQSRDRKDDEKAQARLVYADRSETAGVALDGTGTHTTTSFKVVNVSGQPVHRPRVVERITADARHHEPDRACQEFPLRVPPEGSEWVYVERLPIVDGSTPGQSVSVVIEFRDALGRDWRREEDEQPERVTAPSWLDRLIQSWVPRNR